MKKWFIVSAVLVATILGLYNDSGCRPDCFGRERDEMEMKVSLMQLSNPVDVQWNPPLGFGYLKAYAERCLPDIEFTICHELSDIEASQPDVVGLSVHTQDADELQETINAIRDTGVGHVAVGGHHVTSGICPPLVGATMIPGEAEHSFTRYLGEIMGANLTPFTPPAEIDDLPRPDRMFGLMPTHKTYLITSRGCPFKCSFCSSAKFWGKTRFHSAARVVREIADIMDMFPRIGVIPIWDDLFAADRRRLVKIGELLNEMDIRVRLSSSMNSATVDEGLCVVAKNIGLVSAGIGAESGSDKILKRLKGAGASVGQNQAALDLLKRHEIDAGAGFILGHWDETEDDVHKTYDFIVKNYKAGKLSSHEINILTPMPGTEVWEHALQAGHIDSSFRYSRLRYLAMKSNKLGDIKDWITVREENNSLYLNEHNVPIDTLYQIIEHYEDKIAKQWIRRTRHAARKAWRYCWAD